MQILHELTVSRELGQRRARHKAHWHALRRRFYRAAAQISLPEDTFQTSWMHFLRSCDIARALTGKQSYRVDI
eukprot:1585444-Pyramimonas_sp.AAC.1